MIVGFTITDFKGHEDEAIEYIKKVCILESPDIARNIVNAGVGVNIFSSAITLSELMSQPFSATPIEVQDGWYLLVSAVNFPLELSYNGSILRVAPVEYLCIRPCELQQFKEALSQGVIRALPEVGIHPKDWILDLGHWNDNGLWIDSDLWGDYQKVPS